MTTKATLLRDIRAKCLDCCCGVPSEVRNCHIYTCNLHKYRLGVDPYPVKRGFAKNHSSSHEVLIDE